VEERVMKQTPNVVRLRPRRPGALRHSLFNRVLGLLMTCVIVVGAMAIWRGSTENTSQPHVPTWKGKAP
jgi:hypothetical protein